MGFIPLYFSGITNIDNIWQHFVKGFSAHVCDFIVIVDQAHAIIALPRDPVTPSIHLAVKGILSK